MTDETSMNAARTFEKARALHQQGLLALAEHFYKRTLALAPAHFDALNLLGVLAGQSNKPEQAVQYFEEAIAVAPNNPFPYCNRGFALAQINKLHAALASFDQAIALNNSDAIPFIGRGNIYKALGNLDRALADYDMALRLKPDAAQAHFNRGAVLQQLRQFDAALSSYEAAIRANGEYWEAYAQRGLVLQILNQFQTAVASYETAVANRPDPVTYLYLGNAQKDLNLREAALQSYSRAISMKADYAEAYSNRGVLLYELNRVEEAVADYDRAVIINPRYAEVYYNRGSVFRSTQHFESAVADFKMAASLKPDIKFLPGALLEAKLQICDWSNIEAEAVSVSEAVERGEPVVHPFAFLTFSDSGRLQKKAAEIFVSEACPRNDSLGALARPSRGKKLRIGYYSADFREHPVPRLIAETIEIHDRQRFEIVAFSFGPDTKDSMRRRLENAFDEFLDVRGRTDREIALLSRSMNIDIAMDLGGYTAGSRTGIFALRAAPIQISYLGYPGTMGSDYMDYLVADETLVLPVEQEHYSEKIIYLPCFQANDSKRRISDRVFTRAELGLPATGFVFCCFNASYKILPPTFDSWMQILKKVPYSVLFLDAKTATIAQNLKEQSRKRGVDSDRLVFGSPLSLPDWLARHRVADLFLDTLPYNAGTTASDALWAGLPVLTCMGATFTGKMAASLLRSVDLPELIASSPERYEELAVQLALDPSRLADLRQRLAQNRLTKPLFDQRHFTKRLELAFTLAHERYLANLPPEHIHITAESK